MKTLFFTLSLFLTFNPVLASDEIVDSMSEEQKEQFVLCAHQDQKFNHGLGTLFNFYEKYYDRFVEYEEGLIAKGKLDPSKSFSNIIARGAYDAEEGPRQVPTKNGGGKGLVFRNDLAGGAYDAEEGPRQVPTKKGNGGKGLVFRNDLAGGAYDAEEGPRQVPTKKGNGGKGLVFRNDLAGGAYDAEEGPRQVPTKKGNGGKGLAVFTEDTTPLVKQVQVRRLFTFK